MIFRLLLGRRREYASLFKHLDYIINDNLRQGGDVNREIMNIFVCTLIHIHAYMLHRCSTVVKITLFKTLFKSSYDLAL